MLEVLLFIVFLYCWGSLSEWVAHRYVMHKKVPGLEYVYKDHAQHHGAFHNSFTMSRSVNRFKGLVLCLEHGILFLTPVLVTLILLNKWLLVLVTIVFLITHFFLYNKLHAAMHLNHKITWLPLWWLRTVYWNHFMHHRHEDKYFCVAFPGADWVFNTVCTMSCGDEATWESESNTINKLVSNWKDTNEDSIRRADKCVLAMSKLSYWISELILFIFVGDVRFHGIDNLYSISTLPTLYVMNHGSWRDVFIFKLLNPDVRIVAAEGVTNFPVLGKLFFTELLGCFPANKSTVARSRDLLHQGDSVAICPEGWAWLDGNIRKFKIGAGLIAKDKEGIKVVPVRVVYGHYHKPWILNFSPLVQYIISGILLLPLTRSGVDIYIGRALSPEDLPSMPLDSVDYLRYVIEDLA